MSEAELLKELKWRLDDIRQMLMQEGVSVDGPSRIYGCDEWSTPVVNLKSALVLIERYEAEKQ